MTASDPVATLIQTYHELNANVVDELHEEPSALEFMRYVAKNRPFVIRGAASDWKATQAWSAEYLKSVMGGEKVRVVVTPHGNADAAVQQGDGSVVFVEPYETFRPFEGFIDEIRSARQDGNVKYAQTQNDNLRSEYSRLYQDVPQDIPFARIALGQSADAINLWMGDNRTVTSLHKDNYENIYVQVRGQKHFVLLPPVEMPCVNEQAMQKGTYVPVQSSENHDELRLEVHLDEDSEPVPVATWDPDAPEDRTTPYSHLSKPLRVTLWEGDVLYLPAMWLHKVSQTVGEEGFVCAVNYWYDMDFSGGFWAQNNFLRDIAEATRLIPEYGDLRDMTRSRIRRVVAGTATSQHSNSY
ncbi:Clavaminate synthase-like protein [Teratosphaeria nubilosa]|uniref:Clavaminate synthase-like protein n=1 Tax=Teratosphaeria nubilosa TaxID=161662 RepID=A0A6G1LME8_9PEZI|nr:Clavaminate synthase-like protein [Teratosphaeria nubilosa]